MAPPVAVARAFAALGVAAAIGCGAASSAVQAGVYRNGRVAFRLGDVPSSWRPVRVDRATLAYRDEPHLASILLDARCDERDEDIPLVALTDHLLMGTTERHFASQDVVPLDGREAMRSRLDAKLDGVPMDYDIFVLKKDGCVYDFVYVAEPPHAPPSAPTPADERKEGALAFERFVAGFRTLDRGRGGGA